MEVTIPLDLIAMSNLTLVGDWSSSKFPKLSQFLYIPDKGYYPEYDGSAIGRTAPSALLESAIA